MISKKLIVLNSLCSISPLATSLGSVACALLISGATAALLHCIDIPGLASIAVWEWMYFPALKVFICMGVRSACMSVHHMLIWYLQRAEVGIGSHDTGDSCESLCGC